MQPVLASCVPVLAPFTRAILLLVAPAAMPAATLTVERFAHDITLLAAACIGAAASL